MATNTTATVTNHTGNGSTNNFAISFSFLANDEEDKIILLILNIPLLFMPKNYSTFCQIIC